MCSLTASNHIFVYIWWFIWINEGSRGRDIHSSSRNRRSFVHFVDNFCEWIGSHVTTQLVWRVLLLSTQRDVQRSLQNITFKCVLNVSSVSVAGVSMFCASSSFLRLRKTMRSHISHLVARFWCIVDAYAQIIFQKIAEHIRVDWLNVVRRWCRRFWWHHQNEWAKRDEHFHV